VRQSVGGVGPSCVERRRRRVVVVVGPSCVERQAQRAGVVGVRLRELAPQRAGVVVETLALGRSLASKSTA
jgi:hypothetical protein